MTAKALDSGHREPVGPDCIHGHGNEMLSDPMAPVGCLLHSIQSRELTTNSCMPQKGCKIFTVDLAYQMYYAKGSWNTTTVSRAHYLEAHIFFEWLDTLLPPQKQFHYYLFGAILTTAFVGSAFKNLLDSRYHSDERNCRMLSY